MADTTEHDFMAVDVESLRNPDPLPGIIAILGELKPAAIITEEGVAHIFSRCVTSVKRAVERGELPPPTRLFGGNCWTVGALVRHIEDRLEEAAREAEQMEQKIKQLSP